MTDETNKRTFYRIDDKALIKLRVLDHAARAALEADFDAQRMHYSLNTHVGFQRTQREPLLNRIRKRHSDVAHYLDQLEAQMEMLATQLMKDRDSGDCSEPQTVNISATGLRFHARETLAAGQVLELGLLLYPSERAILTIAEASRVDALPDGQGFDVSTRFLHVHDEDQEMLIRHIHKVQQQRLQSERDDKADKANDADDADRAGKL